MAKMVIVQAVRDTIVNYRKRKSGERFELDLPTARNLAEHVPPHVRIVEPVAKTKPAPAPAPIEAATAEVEGEDADAPRGRSRGRARE